MRERQRGIGMTVTVFIVLIMTIFWMLLQFILSLVFKYNSRNIFRFLIVVSIIPLAEYMRVGIDSSEIRCSVEKSSKVNSFSAILCIVLQEFATVPTLYVSNSFPLMDYLLLTKIVRTPFRFSWASFPKTQLRINSSPTPPPRRHRG